MAKDCHSACDEPGSIYPIRTKEPCPHCDGTGEIDYVNWGPVVCDLCGKTEYECGCVPDIFHRG